MTALVPSTFTLYCACHQELDRTKTDLERNIFTIKEGNILTILVSKYTTYCKTCKTCCNGHVAIVEMLCCRTNVTNASPAVAL